MKTILKLGGVVIVLLFLLTACNLNQVSVQWAITNTGLAGSLYTVAYDIWNDGKYDLKGSKSYLQLRYKRPPHPLVEVVGVDMDKPN